MSYKLVPVEPTKVMVRIGESKAYNAVLSNHHNESLSQQAGRTFAAESYRAMLSASPKVQIDEGMVERAVQYAEGVVSGLGTLPPWRVFMRRALFAALTPEQEG